MEPTPPAVDWGVAASVAARLARRDPFGDLVPVASLQPCFDELTAQAEVLVAETTGLPRLAGPGRARVADRTGWVDANLASFQRLLRPLTDRFGERLSGGRVAPLGRRVAGAEVGVLLGWMSTRVLGQYDLLIVEDERPEDQDLVYYVGPNIVGLERRFAFPSREFRLWIALHECTHRAQFTGVPWLRPHFLGLVDTLLGSVDPDPGRFLAGVKAAVAEARSGGKPLDRGGLAALVATPEQRRVLDQLGGLMALLEGHGEVTMDRAGQGLVPSAERFGRVLRARRQSARGMAKLFQRLVGLDTKLAQYEQGTSFITAVEAAGGEALFAKVWQGPEWLPTLEEIRHPEQWVDRARNDVPGPLGLADR
ncbi:MAG: hypothetical protein GEV08_08430 [Acidimicrobiia bacterium]|nr:hypothetical protein [Acidimicrobiia bacterium]